MGPETGDIIVRQKQHEDGLVYVLHTASRPDQIVVRSREEAIAHAAELARRERVNAWFTIDGHEFTPLKLLKGPQIVDRGQGARRPGKH